MTRGSTKNSTASSSCLVCPSQRTTQLLGATSLADCMCQEDLPPGYSCGSGRVPPRIEVEGTCTPCGEGLLCPAGSTLLKLKQNTAAATQRGAISLLVVRIRDIRGCCRGISAWMKNPSRSTRCLTGCPGGAPGSCTGSRTGIMCSHCPADFFLAEGVPRLAR